MQCQTVKLIHIPACEPFTTFATTLPNTQLRLLVKYAGVTVATEGTTDAEGNYPIIMGVFPSGMVNEWDRFKLTFTDTNDQPIAVDAEGNSQFIIQPE